MEAMKNFYRIMFLAVLFLPFCANRKKEIAPNIDKKGVAYAVQADWLRLSCYKNLIELQGQNPTTQETLKVQPARSIEAVTASEAVRQ